MKQRRKGKGIGEIQGQLSPRSGLQNKYPFMLNLRKTLEGIWSS